MLLHPKTVVEFGGGCAAVLSVVSLLTLLISAGNESANTLSSVFFCLLLVLCVACAGSVFLAQVKKVRGAFLIAALTGCALSIVLMSFMIADAADPECENNLLYFWRCLPGTKQDVFMLVLVDAVILASVIYFVISSLRMWKRAVHAENPRVSQDETIPPVLNVVVPLDSE